MTVTTKRYTAEDLWQMPGDKRWELWGGELREVPGANGWSSMVAARVIARLTLFVEAGDLGVITGADGTYILARDPDTAVDPDVGFIRWDRLPEEARLSKQLPVPPDLAVEIQSPSDEPGDMARKRDLYRRAGVPLQWWVDPIRRTVSVYRNGELVAQLGEGDELDGGDVLPSFRLPVRSIFPPVRRPIQ